MSCQIKSVNPEILILCIRKYKFNFFGTFTFLNLMFSQFLVIIPAIMVITNYLMNLYQQN